jgi:Bacterial SH3 domain
MARTWSRRFAALLALSLLPLGQTFTAHAALATEFCVEGSPDGTLNFRSGPSASARIIATLNNGDCGIFIADKPARSNNFVRVSYRGTSGWVKSKWIVRSDIAGLEGLEGGNECEAVANTILRVCTDTNTVTFDGGQVFQGAGSKTAFARFLRSGDPGEYRFEAYGASGVLRWPTGDCVYRGTASGSHKVWCGSRSEMSKIATALFPESGGDPDLEVMCVLKGQLEVVNVAMLGFTYDRELCKSLGGKISTP